MLIWRGAKFELLRGLYVEIDGKACVGLSRIGVIVHALLTLVLMGDPLCIFNWITKYIALLRSIN